MPKRDDNPETKVYSGKLNIRIPKSLHARLAEEAKNEGTSLNQLILAKLARPLK
jgi:predicted HicB family RNase H-like nuclease